MVDLVKIRKKAKAESKKQKTEMLPAETETAAPEAAAPPPPKSAQKPAEAQPTPDSELRTQDQTQSSVPSPQSSKLDKFKEHAGEKREGFGAEAEEAIAGEELELLTFTLAHEQYAVDIERIVEIVPPRTITRIPNADSSIVGIMSLRGTIVTLIDVRQRLRHPAVDGEHPDRRIIVLEHGGETLGFEVDRVLRVVKADPASIEPHPVVHASELHEAIRGVFRPADALTILLDFEKLLA